MNQRERMRAGGGSCTTFSLRGEGPGQPPRNTALQAPDGSWCEVREDREVDDARTVWETGPRTLWRRGHPRSVVPARPTRMGRFGLTVTAEQQSVWLDNPNSEHIWTRQDQGVSRR